MMVKYSKPMVIVDQGLAEGVYADSGLDVMKHLRIFIRDQKQAEVISEFR